MPQKSEQLELAFDRPGEVPGGGRSVEAPTATTGNERSGTSALMERVCQRPNLLAALKRVRRNKGSPGVDGMSVVELREHLRVHWLEIREQLLAGTYQPQPVKRVMIPKSDGGTRQLGIPTALDRFIQQAILQVLQPDFDRTFSEHSHGFRPGRSAHDAVREARGFVQEGCDWVVDVDLEKFFDRVNHDVLMGRLAKRVLDKRLLQLIRRYLEAGILADGVVLDRFEGTPQGGPLSPLLANVLLDEVDKELEQRGHKFVRYADDCNVYVRSERAGKRVLEVLRRSYERLRLRINEKKSAVGLVHERSFLGFTIEAPFQRARVRIAPKSMDRFKSKVRQLTRRTRGQSIQSACQALRLYLPGWRNYFGPAMTNTELKLLDGWIRRRVRALQLKQWKTAKRTRQVLRSRGCPEDGIAKVAFNVGAKRWWHSAYGFANLVLPNKEIVKLGLPALAT
jgi:RNA-directed DNA polymerase